VLVADHGYVKTSAKRQHPELLSTGQAAELLGCSRQHVVDLCASGRLPFVSIGVHRRVARADLEATMASRGAETRADRRSRWLNVAVAGALVDDPDRVLGVASTNLARLRRQHPHGQAARWLGEWQRVLDGPVEGVVAALVADTPRSRELRANSPFAGALPDRDRRRVLEAFRRLSAPEHLAAR
jgi:excisionase family DNA binding protein